jgi:hypothetical protein
MVRGAPEQPQQHAPQRVTTHLTDDFCRMAALMARKAAKKWVGSRRSVRRAPAARCRAAPASTHGSRFVHSRRSVIAETDVQAVLLRKREMQWVLDNDAVRIARGRLCAARFCCD